jgi:hypothetical protein
MNRRWVFLLSAPTVVFLSFAAACSSSDDNGTNKTTGADAGGTDSSESDTSTTNDSGERRDSGSPETLTFTKYASFNPAAGQLPEGVVVMNGTPIVGFAPLGQLMKVLPDGGTEAFGAFTSVSNTYTLGLFLTPQNDVFAAVAVNGASPTPTPGVYKFISTGGDPGAYNTLGAPMGFTNGLDFIGQDLFASDSNGTIFRVLNNGNSIAWKTDAELTGDVTACGSQNPFPIGVNGIGHDDTYVYGVNFDKGSFFRIQRNTDGSAGAIEILFKTCNFFGADGVVRDTDGTFIVANSGKNRIDRVTLGTNNASYKTIASGAPLDGPASVFIEGTAPNKKLWVTNSAFASAAADAGPTPALLSAPLK